MPATNGMRATAPSQAPTLPMQANVRKAAASGVSHGSCSSWEGLRMASMTP